MKTYVTFGQVHIHKIGEKVFDKDCVAVIECSNPKEGRELAFEYFDRKFYSEYPEEHFKFSKEDMGNFFPRGFIEVN